MSTAPLSPSQFGPQNEAKSARILTLKKWGLLYARIALGGAFLSAVADRFGLWGKKGGWGNFANFTRYVAEVNFFMPALTIPFLAWTATAAELFFWHRAGFGYLATLGGLRQRAIACVVWHSHGHFFWR